MKNRLIGFIAATVILGVIGSSAWLLVDFFGYLQEADKIVVTAVIAMTGVLVTTVTGLWIKKLEKRYEVEAQFRTKKVDMLSEIVNQINDLGRNKLTTEELVARLESWQRQLLFAAGPDVLKRFMALKNGGIDGIETINDLWRASQLIGDLILAMRKDVGLSNFGLDKSTFWIHYTLRNSDAFLKVVKEAPQMGIAEYAAMETLLDVAAPAQNLKGGGEERLADARANLGEVSRLPCSNKRQKLWLAKRTRTTEARGGTGLKCLRNPPNVVVVPMRRHHRLDRVSRIHAVAFDVVA